MPLVWEGFELDCDSHARAREPTWRAVLGGGIIAAVRGDRPRRLLGLVVAAAVAVAFADSSIVVLALPDLYARFATSLVGVSWVITSYNLVLAGCAFALIGVIRRVDVGNLTRAGLVLFCAGSVGAAVSGTLPALIVFRCVQGAGAAMMLAGALALLSTLCGSRASGVAMWIAAGTFGAALGPALGGILTQLFSWRAIFVFQAPVALVALVAAAESHSHPRGGTGANSRAAANVALGLLFGALVGALFLAVLLLVNAWGLSPIAGAAALTALPLAALVASRLTGELSAWAAAAAGALLLAGGLVVLALLPATGTVIFVAALLLCGTGIGLAVPVLTHRAVAPDEGLVHDGTITIGARHAGLVLALVLVAPVLSSDLQQGTRDALLGGTKVLLNADIPIRQEVPIVLDLGKALKRAQRGTVPDLAQPFNRQGAAHDPALRQVRDSLLGAVRDALTRSFRTALALCALLAALALVPILLARRRALG
jgi:predicted MFS family arabinose efflux permease